MSEMDLYGFVAESNRIEGITRKPTSIEVEAHKLFLAQSVITTATLQAFVSAVSSGKLRSNPGMDVRVGNHIAPPGGPEITAALDALLYLANTAVRSTRAAYLVHIEYETLHPFTDGNGRSGRALWLWMHSGIAPIGFLHSFYYSTLDAQRPHRG